MRLGFKFLLLVAILVLQTDSTIPVYAINCTQVVARHYISMLERSRDEAVIELRRLFSTSAVGFELPPEAREYWSDPQRQRTYLRERALEDQIWRRLYFSNDLPPILEWIVQTNQGEMAARVIARMFVGDKTRSRQMEHQLQEAKARLQTARDSVGDARNSEELAFAQSLLTQEASIVAVLSDMVDLLGEASMAFSTEGLEDYARKYHGDNERLHEMKARMRRSIERASAFAHKLATSKIIDSEVQSAFQKSIEEAGLYDHLVNLMAEKRARWVRMRDLKLIGSLYYFGNYNERETARKILQHQTAKEWVAKHPLQLPSLTDISTSGGDQTSWSFHFGRQMIADGQRYADLLVGRIAAIDAEANANPSMSVAARQERQFYSEMLQIVRGEIVPNYGSSMQDAQVFLTKGGASADCRREVHFRLKLIEDEILERGSTPELQKQREFYEFVAALNAQILEK